jgi:protein required for attachment to host cells/ribosome-associated translation inhibitor RaiA
MNMAAKQKPTWIAVSDGAQARFFALSKNDDGVTFEEAADAMQTDLKAVVREERGNKPGRSFASAGGGLRHAMEPRSNYLKLEKHNFAREVAAALDTACAKGRYGPLVLVAPPRSLGELRELLSERVLSSVTLEVPKDLTQLTPNALWKQLSTHFVKAAKINPAKSPKAVKAKVSAIPLSIVFRSMDPSVSIKAMVHKHLEKLGRKFDRIVNCRVIVEAPLSSQRKGKLFRVAVELELPGRDIAAKSKNAVEQAHEDVDAALRNAFNIAGRQLHDYMERMKSSTPQARRTSSMRPLKLREA